tara:strand:- start:1820 stop:1972 length:153 start_codon:yes stop_codon:yes gene_type:complete
MAQIFSEWWPQISALAVIVAAAISFRADVMARLREAEKKISTLFTLWNQR